MPIVYDDPAAPQPVKPPKPKPEPSPMEQYGPEMANKVMIQADRMAEMFKDVDLSVMTTAPDTLTWTMAAQNDPKLTYAFNDSTLFMSRVYGSEGMTPAVASNLLDLDPARMEATLATVNWLIANQTGIEEQSMFGAPDPDIMSKDDLIAYVLSGQDVKALSPQEQLRTLSFAEEMLATLEPLADVGISGEYKKAIEIGFTKDYTLALTPDDIAYLQASVGQLKDMLGGATQELGPPPTITGITTDLGLEQVRKLGEGVIVLDEEWAKGHFAEAYAVQVWLEQTYPGMTVQLGREGAIGSILDKFGQAVDYISAPVSGFISQVAELWGEQAWMSPEDRANAAAEADRLEAKITAGEFTPDETAQALRVVAFLRDSSTNDAGMDLWSEDIARNTRPTILGGGFADTVTRAADMLPGDPGYGFAHATLFLASNILFDPTTYIAPIVAGLKAGKYVGKLDFNALKGTFADAEAYAKALMKGGIEEPDAMAAARAVWAEGEATGYITPVLGNSWIKNAVYRRLARTPEELMTTRPFMDSVDRIWALKGQLGDQFAAGLQRGLGVSGDAAAYIARAATREDMGIAVMRAQMGLVWTPPDIARLEARLAATEERLRGITLEMGPRGEWRYVDNSPPPGARFFHGSGARTAPAQTGDAWWDDHLFAAIDRRDAELYGRQIERITLHPEARVLYADTAEYDAIAATVGGQYKFSLIAQEAERQGFAAVAFRDQGAIGTIILDEGAIASRSADIPRIIPADDLMGLRVDRLFLRDTIKGRDWMRPMTNYLTPKAFRRLERVVDAPYGRYGKAMNAMLDMVERFPGNLLDLVNATRADDTFRAHGQRYFISMRNMYRPTGAGNLLSLPHTSFDARALRTLGDEVKVLSIEDSFQAMWDMGEFLGVSRKRMREIMAPWSKGELTTQAKSYEWLTSSWQRMVEESPYVPTWAKDDLRTMWKSSLTDERSAGYVVEEVTDSAGNVARMPSPTLYRLEDGLRIGRPAIEADMLQAWRLPDLGSLRTYMTHAGQTMKAWEKFETHKAINTALLAVQQGWASFASLWKVGTLGTRLLGALPLRIASEEMLRMAGYDYASAVWHPVEWFSSTALGGRYADADLRMFMDSPIHALGAAVQDMADNSPYYLARTGRTVVTLDDEARFPGVYYRAISNRLDAMHNSYSSRVILGNMDDPAAVVAKLQGNERGRAMLKDWTDDGVFTAEQAVSRIRDEMQQLLGTGDGAEIVRIALQRGSVKVDDAFQISETGTKYSIGTRDFADLLKRMEAEGVWKPPSSKLAVSAGDYLPIEKERAFWQAANTMFRYGYAAPDLAVARSPLFRQMAKRNYHNLIARGYRPQDALRLARAEAARGTADLMFTIGQKTSGEWAIRNFMPFFPAYRELASTWLRRVPMRVGEGHWALGAATMMRRADYWTEFFKQAGIIEENREGKPVVKVPFMAQVLSFITGGQVEFEAEAPVESFVGILPLPLGMFEDSDTGEPLPWYQRLRGILPTLGGPASMALGGLNAMLDGKLDPAEDWLTMYGTDQSMLPFAIDRLLGAFGIDTPFATNTTTHLAEATRTWATIDGMRIAARNIPYPSLDDLDADGDGDLSPAEQQAGRDRILEWKETIVSAGEAYQSRLYLLKGISAMMLPFSVRYEDDAKAEMGTLWSLINVLPDSVGGGEVRSAFIDAFMADNPELGSYMTGKSWDTRLVDDPDESFDEYMEAVKSGAVQVRTPEEWAIFSLGMNSYQIYKSRLDAIYEEAGDTWAERILNFDAREQAAAMKDAWDDFLDYTSTLPPSLGMTQSFKDMFEQYQNYIAARDGDSPRLSIEEDQFLEFDRSMKDMAEYFSPNPVSSADYYKMRDRIYKKLDAMGANSSMAEATNWWYENVQGPYYDKRNELYEKLDALPFDDPKRGLIYNQLRELADSYQAITNEDHPEWGEAPSPEQYAFLKLDAPAQRRQTVAWAALPPEYLTRFQRETVGYDVPENKQDEASQLASIMARKEAAFDRWMVETDTSYNSIAYKDKRAELDKAIAAKAEDLGLKDYYQQMQEPAFVRIGEALNLSQDTVLWDQAVAVATDFRRQIEAAGYSPGGSSDIAEEGQKWLASEIQQARKNNQMFDTVMNELALALGEDGKPLQDYDLVRVLFFDVYIP